MKNPDPNSIDSFSQIFYMQYILSLNCKTFTIWDPATCMRLSEPNYTPFLTFRCEENISPLWNDPSKPRHLSHYTGLGPPVSAVPLNAERQLRNRQLHLLKPRVRPDPGMIPSIKFWIWSSAKCAIWGRFGEVCYTLTMLMAHRFWKHIAARKGHTSEVADPGSLLDCIRKWSRCLHAQVWPDLWWKETR